MSTSMPPPLSPLAHRRSKRLIISSSLSSSPECMPRKMSLSKGATFHLSSSPSNDDPVLSIPHLPRRSPTASQSMLASWLSDKKDIAQSLADFEQTFSGARGKRRSTHRQSAQDFEQQLRVHRASLPRDEALGSSIGSPASDKGLSQTFERALDLVSDKDSGLGSSLPEDEEAVRGLVQGWLARCLLMISPGTNVLLAETNKLAKPVTQPPSARQRTPPNRIPAVTASIAPPTRTARRHPPLSSLGRKTINKHILGPILREDRFEDFHDLVTSLGSTQNKAVRCLRDLEQSLIFQPLVRILTAVPRLTSDNDKSLAISQTLYRTFGEFTVQLVLDTYSQLSEADQRRTSDRPYDNGYFLDLVQQVGRLAAQVGRNNEGIGQAEDDDMAYSPDDEVTLEGGLGATGDHAELVRWKNGKGISLRTGLPYEAAPGIKREASSLLDDDVSRSMARRKKGYIPEIIEMKCSDKSCDKIFTRKCDLAKHEKTHSRPFKCPVPGCKYAELGLPTEKERERHMNDKHDPNPHYYRCQFCEFKTKRESNCKQHQEKKHNWTYSRAKGKDKANAKMTSIETPATPAMEYPSSMQSPATSLQSSNWDDRSMADSVAPSAHMTPYDQPMTPFEGYGQAPNPLFPREGQQMFSTGYEAFGVYRQNTYVSPTSTTPMTPNNMMGTPITPAYSNITGQSPFLANMDMTNDCGNNQPYNAALPTPDSFLQPHSRNPSISHQSPMYEPSDDFNFSDPIVARGAAIPGNDFTLFRGESTSPFSNPAAASATLFPADFAALDNHPIFDEGFMEDDCSFIDFDAMTS
ncbi:hypothetical protein DV736_g4380, partial [Chaetothyriales sp. CBS 134916]